MERIHIFSTLETTSCNYVLTFLNVLVVCRIHQFLPLTTSRGVDGYSQGRQLGVLRSKDFGHAAESLPSASLML